jgi:AcrR family transcriptional regulator
MDPRVRKSRDALGDALIGLMQEKPFSEITVQEVLDRAGVSRSTFYHHFKDKDDLFTRDAGEFFEQVAHALTVQGDQSDRVFPIREFFTHVAAMKTFIANLAASGKLHENMSQGRVHFARGIEQRLSVLGRARGLPPADRPAVAMAYAGVVVSLLLWWHDQGMVPSPAEIDELFHRLVWSGLEVKTPVRTPSPWI